MLATVADSIPESDGGFLFEPKWDGFRAIVFRGGTDVYIQSRDLKPLDRYFPELHDALLQQLPDGCVVDGEIVIVTPDGLAFDALQMRLHPAASRVEQAGGGDSVVLRGVRCAGRRWEERDGLAPSGATRSCSNTSCRAWDRRCT